MRSVSSSVMPATGSSSSSSFGSCISSMPISSHCFWPCDSRPAVRVALLARGRSVSSISSMRSRCSPRRAARTACCSTPLSALQRELAGSRTPCGARTPSASGTCGRCRARAISASRQLGQVDRLPPKNTLPASGRVLPVMTSIIVVLPAPLGPMMQRSSPASSASESVVQRLEAVEADGDVVEVQDAAAVRRGRARRRRRGRPSAPSARRSATSASAFGCASRRRRRLRSAPSPRSSRAATRRLAAACGTRPTTPSRQEQRHDDEQRAEEVQPELAGTPP